MFIENISYEAIKDGLHYDAGENSLLIQISDPDMSFPMPKYKFKKITQYNFLDIEHEHPGAITNKQAESIVNDLLYAKENNMNVIVHCHAGVCRSGAVTEVGVILGFQDTEKFRAPNLRVKHKMLSALGMNYDPNESEYSVHGTFSASGIFLG